ncbi:hypothetical protein HJC23_012942 [Cyclotella cryptica]|uniref:SET domain-containing protein n=1 Tax=Cyclotella cryptica TaxID=29204 RepID=A0ABD3Q2L7_9STRA|eukprot:CCRYP_009281-RA/>CCRYP_009281-RA protein AED:0.19 eAED:0.19 QI:151/1/1/1/1/1/2/578/273
MHHWVVLMEMVIQSLIFDDLTRAISTEDIAIHLTNAPYDDSVNLMSTISTDISSVDCQDVPQCATSVNESGTPTANDEEALSSDREWEKYSFADMYDYLDCWAHAANMHKPLYRPEMWALIKGTFASQAGIDSSLLVIDDTNRLDYYSGYAEGKGRGTFAARDFSKGELVHDGSRSTIFWNDGLAWKEYIMSLPHPMTCDVLEWTWIQQVRDEGWLLCLNTNDAAFFNHEDDFNIAPLNATSLEFYAVRDIKKGEELTYDYFIFDTDWNLFGL